MAKISIYAENDTDVNFLVEFDNGDTSLVSKPRTFMVEPVDQVAHAEALLIAWRADAINAGHKTIAEAKADPTLTQKDFAESPPAADVAEIVAP